MNTRVQRYGDALRALEFICVPAAYVLMLTGFAYKIAEAAGYMA
jgi:hypothetical protein